LQVHGRASLKRSFTPKQGAGVWCDSWFSLRGGLRVLRRLCCAV
jgi:hypothetical protein